MFVKLFTGLPGAGKTAQLVAEMVRLSKEESHRPLFAMGINGLKEGLATELTMEQLQEWWELPPGSIIAIDECQEEHLMPKDQGKPKAWVQRIAKVRHHGMTFLLTTQHPQNMSAFVRRLVDQHVHTVNKFGTAVIARYTWGRCMDDPEKRSVQKSAIEDLGTLPAEVFELYKSSQLHTRKRRIPRKLYMMVALFALAVTSVVALPFVFMRAQHAGEDKPATVDVPKPAEPSPTWAGGGSRSSGREAMEDQNEAMRRDDYVRWMTPRVPGQPWTAPAFDHLQVQAQPRVFCVASETGDCHCRTEQGTRYETDLNVCRAMVKEGGPYNPFQPPPDLVRDNGRERATPVAASPPASPAMAVAAGGLSGWDRSIGPPSYTPPERTGVGAVGR